MDRPAPLLNFLLFLINYIPRPCRCPSSSRAPTTSTARTSSRRSSVQCGGGRACLRPGAGLWPCCRRRHCSCYLAAQQSRSGMAQLALDPACARRNRLPHPNTPLPRSTKVCPAGIARRAAAGARRRACGAVMGTGSAASQGADCRLPAVTHAAAPAPAGTRFSFGRCCAPMQVRSYLYVEDVAEAFDIILHKVALRSCRRRRRCSRPAWWCSLASAVRSSPLLPPPTRRARWGRSTTLAAGGSGRCSRWARRGPPGFVVPAARNVLGCPGRWRRHRRRRMIVPPSTCHSQVAADVCATFQLDPAEHVVHVRDRAFQDRR